TLAARFGSLIAVLSTKRIYRGARRVSLHEPPNAFCGTKVPIADVGYPFPARHLPTSALPRKLQSRRPAPRIISFLRVLETPFERRLSKAQQQRWAPGRASTPRGQHVRQDEGLDTAPVSASTANFSYEVAISSIVCLSKVSVNCSAMRLSISSR